MDSEPRRIVRREVRRTVQVRRAVTVHLEPRRAIRLGARLIVRGLLATVRHRKVQLTLRSATTAESPVEAGSDGAATAARADVPILEELEAETVVVGDSAALRDAIT